VKIHAFRDAKKQMRESQTWSVT